MCLYNIPLIVFDKLVYSFMKMKFRITLQYQLSAAPRNNALLCMCGNWFCLLLIVLSYLLFQSIMQESEDVTLNFGEEDELDQQKRLK